MEVLQVQVLQPRVNLASEWLAEVFAFELGYGNQKRNMGPYAIIFQNKTKHCNKNGANSYCDKLFLVQYLVTAWPLLLKGIGIYLHMAPENPFGCHTPNM
jgi:hypothetical protein